MRRAEAKNSRMVCRLLIVPVVFSIAYSWGQERLRIRDLGVRIGTMEPGPFNAITDVPGVLVGQETVIQGDDLRTGVTAILPHSGNLFQEKVAAAVYVGNGFGKLMGFTQVDELGTIETPILLTGTLNVPRVADALLDYMLALPGMEEVRSINPIVGETNDGYLSEVRKRPIGRELVSRAITKATGGTIEEGSVGAGTGTRCFGYKGGIGTASRKVSVGDKEFRVGVLVQSNFSGRLEIGGVPVGELLEKHVAEPLGEAAPTQAGSCMIVAATDAPLESRNLKRLAKRSFMGLAATGSWASNGSGDYVIAFTVARGEQALPNDQLDGLFQGVKESTEEAILNSITMATTIIGRNGNRAEAVPLDRLKEVLRDYRVIHE